jgi:preprotein translocase subunit SecG
MLNGLLLTLNILVCLALIGVVLLQRSEGGALGTGGSPGGLITTRGAGDLLTRTTWILFGLFLTISLTLTLLGGRERSSQAIIDRLKLQSVNPDTLAPAKTAPASGSTDVPPPVQTQAPATAAPSRAKAALAAPTPTVHVPGGARHETLPAASTIAVPTPRITLPSSTAAGPNAQPSQPTPKSSTP